MPPSDLIPPVPVDAAVASWFAPSGGREERAQLVARRSIDLATRPGDDEIGEVALELMRAGNHDPATLQHALTLCRSLSRDDPTDQGLKRAIRLLQQVTTFLGVPPHLFDARKDVTAVVS